MGIKSKIAGLLAAVSMFSATPSLAAEKDQPKVTIKEKRSEDKENSYPIVDRCYSGLNADGYFYKEDPFEIDFKNFTISYGGFELSYKDKFLDKLKLFIDQPRVYSSSLLDSVAKAVFKIEEIQELSFGGFSVNEIYNVQRFFSNLYSNFEMDEYTGVQRGLEFKVLANSGFYSAQDVKVGEERLLFEHGVEFSSKFDMGLNFNYFLLDSTKGLEDPGQFSLIGSRLMLYLKFDLMFKILGEEGFRFGKGIDAGYEGLGILYQKFLKMDYDILILADFDARFDEQMEKGRILTMFSSFFKDKSYQFGERRLFYIFREQDFGSLWYYAMTGIDLRDYSEIKDFKSYSYDFYLKSLTEFEKDIHKVKDYHKRHVSSPRLEVAGLVGGRSGPLSMFMAFRTFPSFDAYFGTYLRLPRFMGRAVIDTDGNQSFDLYFRIMGKERSLDGLLDLFKMKDYVNIDPLPNGNVKVNYRKKEAYSKMDGLFLFSDYWDDRLSLGLLKAADNFFVGISYRLVPDVSSYGGYALVGSERFLLKLGYSYLKNKGLDVEGHNVDLGFIFDFKEFALNFYLKGLLVDYSNNGKFIKDLGDRDEIRGMITLSLPWD